MNKNGNGYVTSSDTTTLQKLPFFQIYPLVYDPSTKHCRCFGVSEGLNEQINSEQNTEPAAEEPPVRVTQTLSGLGCMAIFLFGYFFCLLCWLYLSCFLHSSQLINFSSILIISQTSKNWHFKSTLCKIFMIFPIYDIK